MISRIYTEDLPVIREYVEAHFDSATIIPTRGIWKGTGENAIIVEVISEEQNTEAIIYACKVIKKIGKQEAVLYTQQEIRGELV